MDKQQLMPCPFCGHDTPEFERLGTPRQSCIVVCGNCGCRHESSDEGEHNGASWNDRAPSPGVDAAGTQAIISRFDWVYPQAIDADAGQRDEARYAAIGHRDGDIVLHIGGYLDAQDLKTMFAWKDAPSPAASAVEQERDRLRAEQAAVVRPLIGPLLDAWDFAQNDVKASITADGIGRHLNAISLAMTTDREGVPNPPSRDCMGAACKPSFDNGADDPDGRFDITRGARDG